MGLVTDKTKTNMKMMNFFASCLFAAAIFGCSTEFSDPQLPDTGKAPVEKPSGSYELTASINAVTKTTLDDLAISWESDDIIYVWTGESFTPYGHEGNGKFKGEKPVALKDGKYVAFYPVASVEGTKASFEIPAEQTFAARKANDLPMVAVWEEGGKCVFSPVCSILEMPLTIAEGVTLASIDYKFNGNVGSGAYTFDYMTGTYSKEVAGDIEITGTFTSGYVYNAVVPGDYTDGFTLTLTDTDNCAMVLTATNGEELAAGVVQPLGAVNYAQLAPEFTVAYNDWAATATLASEKTSGTRYWLSKTVNGEPLTGVAPVDMSNLAKGAAVKLYGYLCSENVAGTGVQAGDKLYLVTELKNGNVSYLRSVEYTYQPDPLEVVLFDDALTSDRAYSPELKGWGGTLNANYTEDSAFGTACMRGELPQKWADMAFYLWDNTASTFANFNPQAKALYNFEFYVKSDVPIKGNTYFAIRYYVAGGSALTSKFQSAWQNFTAAGKEIPAHTWTKVSIPMNQIWLNTAITDPDYKGYNDDGSLTGWLCNYKQVDRIYINSQPSSYVAGDFPTVILVDHFTIRKSTL